MAKQLNLSKSDSGPFDEWKKFAQRISRLRSVPWQIWVVIAMLGIEGLGNFFAIFYRPIALGWLARKILFIVGLLSRWRWVFCLFLVIAWVHFIVLLMNCIFAAAILNLILIILATLSIRFYFPTNQEENALQLDLL